MDLIFLLFHFLFKLVNFKKDQQERVVVAWLFFDHVGSHSGKASSRGLPIALALKLLWLEPSQPVRLIRPFWTESGLPTLNSLDQVQVVSNSCKTTATLGDLSFLHDFGVQSGGALKNP